MAKVRDYMSSPVFQVEENTSLNEACKLMMERGVGALVITRDGEPVGIFTDRDAVKAYATGIGPEEEVKKVATMNVITVDEDTEPYAAVQLMSTKKFRHLPVKDKNGNIIGMFSLSDIAKYLGDY